MDVSTRLKIVGFFLSLSEWDRHIECIRQVLNSIESFEPYAAYLRLTKGKGGPVSASDIQEFLEMNGFEGDYKALALSVRLFDTRFENSLDFEDFLKLILSRDNPDIRFIVAQKPTYEVEIGATLPRELEYILARFFFKVSDFLVKIIKDPEMGSILSKESLFSTLDTANKKKLVYGDLSTFFDESRIVPRDEEIVSILKIIDINDDGEISQEEFRYFTSLFQGKEPDISVINYLKKTVVAENPINYFKETMNYNPTKYNESRESRFKNKTSTLLKNDSQRPNQTSSSRKEENPRPQETSNMNKGSRLNSLKLDVATSSNINHGRRATDIGALERMQVRELNALKRNTVNLSSSIRPEPNPSSTYSRKELV